MAPHIISPKRLQVCTQLETGKSMALKQRVLSLHVQKLEPASSRIYIYMCPILFDQTLWNHSFAKPTKLFWKSCETHDNLVKSAKQDIAWTCNFNQLLVGWCGRELVIVFGTPLKRHHVQDVLNFHVPHAVLITSYSCRHGLAHDRIACSFKLPFGTIIHFRTFAKTIWTPQSFRWSCVPDTLHFQVRALVYFWAAAHLFIFLPPAVLSSPFLSTSPFPFPLAFGAMSSNCAKVLPIGGHVLNKCVYISGGRHMWESTWSKKIVETVIFAGKNYFRELHSELSRHHRWKNKYSLKAFALDNPWYRTFELLSEYICAAAHSDLAFLLQVCVLAHLHQSVPTP